jgi:hypothetical protein
MLYILPLFFLYSYMVHVVCYPTCTSLYVFHDGVIFLLLVHGVI